MNLAKIIVTFLGTVLVGFIYWFFFGVRTEETDAEGDVEILVSGGYRPKIIKLKKGHKTHLLIKRTDTNSCLEEFILPDFRIKKYLPLNKLVKIEIKPQKKGTFGFHCGMNMYHGKIIVI